MPDHGRPGCVRSNGGRRRNRGLVDAERVRRVQELAGGLTPFESGDVLVAKITPCFENGKIAQANTPTPVAYGSTEFHVVRSRSAQVDHRYILHFLRQPWIRRAGQRRMTGSAGQRRLPEAFLKELHVPLPPIRERRRLAAILDQAHGLVSTCRAASESVGHFRDAALRELLSTERDGRWSWPRLSKLAEIQGGLQVTRSRSDYRLRVPYLRVTNVYRGYLSLDEVKDIGVKPAELERTRLEVNDLLVVEGHGNREEIGRVARWTGGIADCVHQNHLIRVRVDESLASPAFRRGVSELSPRPTDIAACGEDDFRPEYHQHKRRTRCASPFGALGATTSVRSIAQACRRS